MNNDSPQQDEFKEGSIQAMQEILKEKSVASVVLGENGTLVVQFGDKLTLYKREISAGLASKLLALIAETQEN